MQIGASSTNPSTQSKAKAKEEASYEFTKKHIGSDYYATHEEEALATG